MGFVIHAIGIGDDTNFSFTGWRGELEGVFEVADVVYGDLSAFGAGTENAHPAIFLFIKRDDFFFGWFAEEIHAGAVGRSVDERNEAGGELFFAAAEGAGDQESVREAMALVCGFDEFEGFLGGMGHGLRMREG